MEARESFHREIKLQRLTYESFEAQISSKRFTNGQLISFQEKKLFSCIILGDIIISHEYLHSNVYFVPRIGVPRIVCLMGPLGHH